MLDVNPQIGTIFPIGLPISVVSFTTVSFSKSLNTTQIMAEAQEGTAAVQATVGAHNRENSTTLSTVCLGVPHPCTSLHWQPLLMSIFLVVRIWFCRRVVAALVNPYFSHTTSHTSPFDRYLMRPYYFKAGGTAAKPTHLNNQPPLLPCGVTRFANVTFGFPTNNGCALRNPGLSLQHMLGLSNSRAQHR
jgi:hypothetical protein